MSYLIALDDGHGMETPGKRTPLFPDGSFMRENEFNRAVVAYLDEHLKRCGFRTLLVAPTDADDPLEARVKRANDANADLYLSIHANALNGVWGPQNGIETYVWPSGKSKQIGSVIHRYLIAGTSLGDRGVKDGSHLYVIRNTKMPAVLVECGFMDNVQEAELLRSDHYRKICASAIAQGVCEAFGVAYVPNHSQQTNEPPAGDSEAHRRDWKDDGLDWLRQNLNLSDQWKKDDVLDMGTLGELLKRFEARIKGEGE